MIRRTILVAVLGCLLAAAPASKPVKPPTYAELKAENDRLRGENERYRAEVASLNARIEGLTARGSATPTTKPAAAESGNMQVAKLLVKMNVTTLKFGGDTLTPVDSDAAGGRMYRVHHPGTTEAITVIADHDGNIVKANVGGEVATRP